MRWRYGGARLDGLHAAAIAAVVSLLVYFPLYVTFVDNRLLEVSSTILVGQAFYQGVDIFIPREIARSEAAGFIAKQSQASGLGSWGLFRFMAAHKSIGLNRKGTQMIVVMKPGSTQRQIEHVVNLVKEMGLKDHVIVGTERTVIAVIGNDRFKDRTVLESSDGVDKVVPILAPYKMASLEVKKERSIVPLGAKINATIGGKKIGVIAGPCSVESKQQTLEIAAAVREAGAVGLRGGAFKPRTNPYSFQGLAEKGLQILAEAREKNRPVNRHRSHGGRSGQTRRRLRGCPASRRTQHAEF